MNIHDEKFAWMVKIGEKGQFVIPIKFILLAWFDLYILFIGYIYVPFIDGKFEYRLFLFLGNNLYCHFQNFSMRVSSPFAQWLQPKMIYIL